LQLGIARIRENVNNEYNYLHSSAPSTFKKQFHHSLAQANSIPRNSSYPLHNSIEKIKYFASL
jgi:hypothetical protein